MSPIQFSSEVKRGKRTLFQSLMNEDGSNVFTDEDIDRIIERAREKFTYEDFETITYEDRPHILVTKVVEVNGQTKHISKLISQLSLGQQQPILLAILIQSKNSVPLLIDQPEDHLDSEFIYKTIVSNLKKIRLYVNPSG